MLTDRTGAALGNRGAAAAQRDRTHREKRRSSASRRKKRRQAKEDTCGTQHADRFSVDRFSDNDIADYNGPASPERGHPRDRETVLLSKDAQTRGPFERSKQDKEPSRKKDQQSRDPRLLQISGWKTA
ncbi:unnamed protein product [Lampetra planeri]